MREGYDVLGNYISLVDERNRELSITNLLGVSIEKRFIPSIANIVGTDLSSYKIVRTGQFAYGPVTSRNGEKISIALLSGEDCIISSSYTVFEIKDKNHLDAEYLMLWFSRPEFDRYARYRSHGSVREIFDWEEMCSVELPVPEISKQKEIVKAYRAITDRIELKRKINDNLVETLKTIYRDSFAGKPFETKSLVDLCSKIGSGATPRGGKESYHNEGISLIRSTNVHDYVFSYSDLAFIDKTQADALSNVTVQTNDVLFNITGVSIARCCIVPPDVLPARVNQHVMILRPYLGEYMSYYLMFTLCDSKYKSLLLGIGQSGSTREAINKQEMEAFTIPVPAISEINAFGTKAATSYSQIRNNDREIAVLLELQRILLSQLSSH